MDVTTSNRDDTYDVRALVVYDAATGAIVHRHYVMNFAGAPPVLDAEAEARAIEMARAHSGFGGAVAVLHVERDTFAQPARYRVDVKARAVVSEPLGLRRRADRKRARGTR